MTKMSGRKKRIREIMEEHGIPFAAAARVSDGEHLRMKQEHAKLENVVNDSTQTQENIE